MKGAMRAGLILAIAAISVAAACGGEDAPPDPEFALRIEVLAPIEEAEVVTVVGPETEYMLRIVSGLPNACAEYKNTLVNIVGDAVTVDVRNTVPADLRVACAAVYGFKERTVELLGLAPATDYTITINATVSLTLTTEAAPVQGQRSVYAPLVDSRLELTASSPPAYDLVVDTGVESTCMTRGEVSHSRSGGHLFGNLIRVNVTNIEEIDPVIECSEEFNPYQVRVTLPGAFKLGSRYELLLNLDERYEFSGGATELRRVK